MDHDLFLMINGLAGSLPLVDDLARLLVNDYFVPTTLCLLLIALWFEPTPLRDSLHHRAVFSTVLAVLIANIFVKAFNLAYFRPRPFFDMEVNLLFYRPADSSFPSNPTAVAFSFVAVIWSVNRRLGMVMAILAGLFSLSRIYAGVHYPSDIIFGAVLGILSGHLARRWEAKVTPLYNLILRTAEQVGLL